MKEAVSTKARILNVFVVLLKSGSSYVAQAGLEDPPTSTSWVLAFECECT